MLLCVCLFLCVSEETELWKKIGSLMQAKSSDPLALQPLILALLQQLCILSNDSLLRLTSFLHEKFFLKADAPSSLYVMVLLLEAMVAHGDVRLLYVVGTPMLLSELVTIANKKYVNFTLKGSTPL